MATVLVVDDEPIVREVVVSYLRREGYRTLEAGDGDRARELLESESPSLVVLDVMLPGTDGLELCRWIRAHSELPVIMLTARGEEADRIVGLELGADDYVTKPFSPRELAARVRTVLRRSRSAAISLKEDARPASSAGPSSGALAPRSPRASAWEAALSRAMRPPIERPSTSAAATAAVEAPAATSRRTTSWPELNMTAPETETAASGSTTASSPSPAS